VNLLLVGSTHLPSSLHATLFNLSSRSLAKVTSVEDEACVVFKTITSTTDNLSFAVKRALKITFTLKFTVLFVEIATKSRYYVPKSVSFFDSTCNTLPSTETANV
jgi:hypothetical protein